MKRFVSIAALLIAAPLAAVAQSVASLADGRTGRIEFASMTPSGPSELVRGAGAPATVGGTLVLPDGTTARMPAMVIAHGSGGILAGREDAWAARLNGLGIATFVVDSFTPRGLSSTARDQSRLSTMANLADALAALKLLATHPRIDPARIGVMGFSRGGQVALYSSLEPLRRGMIAGDYTPAAACRDYAAWFTAKGVPVQAITYDGAHHDFDIPEAPRFLQSLQSARDCKAEVEVESGSVRRLDTGETLRDPTAIAAYFRGCMQRGATMGGNPAALARAERDVATFLRETLRPLR
jgi:dienelactone hydrolase